MVVDWAGINKKIDENASKTREELSKRSSELPTLLREGKYSEFYKKANALSDYLFRHREKLEELLVHCDSALKKLDDERRALNVYKQYYEANENARSQLAVINFILRCGPNFENSSTGRTKVALRARKLKLLADFTHRKDFRDAELIPLSEQITELRLTEEPTYVHYLVGEFIRQKEWSKGLYCLKAVALLDGNSPKTSKLRSEIYGHVLKTQKPPLPTKNTDFFPSNCYVVPDTNILLKLAFPDFDKYTLGFCSLDERKSLLEWIKQHASGRGMNVVLMQCVEDELWKVIKARLDTKFNEYQPRITDSLNQAKAKLGISANQLTPDCKEESELQSRLNEFYEPFLSELECLTDKKILGKDSLSDKLGKLAARESLHPERGDLRLLANVILIHRSEKKPVCILTDDNDFIHFAGDIEKEFGISIVEPPQEKSR